MSLWVGFEVSELYTIPNWFSVPYDCGSRCKLLATTPAPCLSVCRLSAALQHLCLFLLGFLSLQIVLPSAMWLLESSSQAYGLTFDLCVCHDTCDHMCT